MLQNLFPTLCLLMLSAIPSTTKSAEPTPAPATGLSFALPLKDSSTSQAIILPIDASTAYLVYATKTGAIGLWTMTNSQTPPVPPSPVPPTPDTETLRIAVVENPANTTRAQRQVLAAEAWRTKAKANHQFHGILPSTLVDRHTGEAPPHLQPFLEEAKRHALPRLIMFRVNGSLHATYPIPTTEEELEKLIPLPRAQTHDRSHHHKKELARPPA